MVYTSNFVKPVDRMVAEPNEEIQLMSLTEIEETTSLVDTAVVEESTNVYRLAVLVITWGSMFLLFGLGGANLAIALIHKDTGDFAFALDAILDAADSFVIIWRFCGKKSVYSQNKERIACTFLAVLALFSAVALVTKGILTVSDSSQRSDENDILWQLALADGSMCFVLCVIKVFLAQKLRSLAVGTDALNSGMGALLSFSVVASEAAVRYDPDVWYIDPVIGFICAGVFFGYGLWLIYELHLRPYCRKNQPV